MLYKINILQIQANFTNEKALHFIKESELYTMGKYNVLLQYHGWKPCVR